MDVSDRAGRNPLSYYGSKESSPAGPQHSTRVWIKEDRGLGAGCAAGAGGNAGWSLDKREIRSVKETLELLLLTFP